MSSAYNAGSNMKPLALAGLGSIALIAMLAQQREPPTRFEVADVHRSPSAPNPYTWASGGVLRGARYDLRKATMIDLIRAAYGVEPDVIVGGPNWLDFDRFDVSAKAEPGTPTATIRLMLQDLLADRFKLQLHRDTRPMPAFALALGKSKPRLKESERLGDAGCTYQQQPNGSVDTVFSCRNITMDALAAQLRGMAGDYLASSVVNQTGLDGTWDFDLKWHRRSQVLPQGTERATIFDAVEKQTGLSLTNATAAMQVIAIDRVNENPTPKQPDTAAKIPPRVVDFEVADLKMNRTANQRNYISPTPGGGLEARHVEMKILLATGWDMDWDHVDEGFANLAKWVSDAYVDVHAKPPSYTNAPPPAGTGFLDDDARLMIRNLLIERFQMKTHMENRPRDAYALLATRPKLKKADPSQRARCVDARTIPNDPRDLNPMISRLISCQNVTMAQFAASLHGFAADYIFEDVEDATGLTGAYDFTLGYTSKYMLNTQTPGQSSDPGGAISLQEAISKQLGLKLEMRKRPLPVVVIDQMRETPLEN
jgi:uncharacterized protein (TIGR03435 family)